MQVEVLDEAMAEVLRRKRPQDRLRIGFNLWISAHNMLTTHLRYTHPDWSRRLGLNEVWEMILKRVAE